MNALPPVLQRQVALDPDHINVEMKDCRTKSSRTTRQQQQLSATSLCHYYHMKSGRITEMIPLYVVKCAPKQILQQPLFGKRQHVSSSLISS